MKTLLILLALLVFTQADYFEGLKLNQDLVSKANSAMDDFKASLIKYLDCSQEGRPIIKMDWLYKQDKKHKICSCNRHEETEPNPLYKSHFKKNLDRSSIIFSEPIPKFISHHNHIHPEEIYKKALRIAQYL